MSPGILSIQSAVSYGHVGNSAAVFPLQRLGFEVWPIDTVQFSNHTGYGSWRGHRTSPDQVREIVTGIEERGALAHCLAVVSGFLGDAQVGKAVLEAVRRVRAHSPDALYVCDPVMGDEGRGFFVDAALREFFRDQAVANADILTPNHFELSWLADQPIRGIEDALRATSRVRSMGPSVVIATSLAFGDGTELVTLADGPDGAWSVRTPKLPIETNGTGDAFGALMLGSYLQSDDLQTSLVRSVSAIHGVIAATLKMGSRELELINAQDEILQPARLFAAEQVR